MWIEQSSQFFLMVNLVESAIDRTGKFPQFDLRYL